MTLLSKNGFVDGVHGKGAGPCEKKAVCRTIGMWSKLDELIENYLDNVSIADLIKK